MEGEFFKNLSPWQESPPAFYLTLFPSRKHQLRQTAHEGISKTSIFKHRASLNRHSLNSISKLRNHEQRVSLRWNEVENNPKNLLNMLKKGYPKQSSREQHLNSIKVSKQFVKLDFSLKSQEASSKKQKKKETQTKLKSYKQSKIQKLFKETSMDKSKGPETFSRTTFYQYPTHTSQYYFKNRSIF